MPEKAQEVHKLVNDALKQAEGVPLHLDDIEGQTVTITDVIFSKGTYGPYVVMTVVDPNGEVFDVQNGGKLVVDALEHAFENEHIPCQATFVRSGRTWLIE